MKGNYLIKINTKKIKYELNINRNITIIKDKSATGKSILCNLLLDIEKKQRGIELISEVDCVVLFNEYKWKEIINNTKNTIFFIDEDSEFYRTKDFAREISKGNDNYFVIITRLPLYYINYSYKEIYEIHNSGKYNYLVRKYDFEDDILNKNKNLLNNESLIITEDSNSGYELLSNYYINNKVISMYGKSKYINIKDSINNIFIIDGSAFGSEINRFLSIHKNGIYFLHESIEYMILKCFEFDNKKIKDILNNISFNVDSLNFDSYEKYFIFILTKYVNTLGYGINYDKNKLNKYFKTGEFISRIDKYMPYCIRRIIINDEFEWK